MNFIVNYFDFVRKLIPYFLRKPITLDFIKSIVKGLQTTNNQFNVFRDDISFRLAFNSQIIYLEKYLNTVYPNNFPYLSNIHILDGSNVAYFYVYNEIENQSPVYFNNYGETFDPLYINNSTDNNQSITNKSFAINVPNSIKNGVGFDENLLIKRVNFYNLAGKTFEIKYF
jgi:hypothetical protein